MSSSHPKSSRRKEMDVMKMMKSSRKVYLSGNVSEFWVEFTGPEGTPYEEGTWIIHVVLPSEYPFKSPSIGFSNRILHPNVDEASGSVCLDVINQTWTPIYELKNIFDVFLPQLLRYPNTADPLNPSAAAFLQRDPMNYVTLLQEHIAFHATRQKALASIPLPYGPSLTAFEANGNHALCDKDSGKLEGNSVGSNGKDSQGCTASSTDPDCVATMGDKNCFAERDEEEYIPEEIEL